jgi:hypothetical protein
MIEVPQSFESVAEAHASLTDLLRWMLVRLIIELVTTATRSADASHQVTDDPMDVSEYPNLNTANVSNAKWVDRYYTEVRQCVPI